MCRFARILWKSGYLGVNCIRPGGWLGNAGRMPAPGSDEETDRNRHLCAAFVCSSFFFFFILNSLAVQ